MLPILYFGWSVLLELRLRQPIKPRLICACSGVPGAHSYNVGPAHFGHDAIFIVENEKRSVIGKLL